MDQSVITGILCDFQLVEYRHCWVGIVLQCFEVLCAVHSIDIPLARKGLIPSLQMYTYHIDIRFL